MMKTIHTLLAALGFISLALAQVESCELHTNNTANNTSTDGKVLVNCGENPPSPLQDPTPAAAAPSVQPTHVNSIHCSNKDLGPDYYDDLIMATEVMSIMCDDNHQQIPSQDYRSWEHGLTEIYMCNYFDVPITCGRKAFAQAQALLDEHCGIGRGGWVQLEELNGVSIGRDPTNPDGSFISECFW